MGRARSLKKIADKELEEIRGIREFLENEVWPKHATELNSASDIAELISESIPVELVDSVIVEELLKLRQPRFFGGYNALERAGIFANRLTTGDLRLSSKEIKFLAISRCARLLANSDTEKAEKLTKSVGSGSVSEELQIAEAFIATAKGDFPKGLNQLSKLKSPLSKSASFFLVSNKNGAIKSIEWLEQVGYTFDDLDADEKFYFLAKCQESGKWSLALELVTTANIALDYALWLELRDPVNNALGLKKLRDSMGDSQHSLRRLNLALQYDIELNLDAVSVEIDRETARTGGKSVDAGVARFVFALTQKSEREIAEYINRHRDQLNQFIDTTSIAKLEIEMLSRAGQIQDAKKRLKELRSMDVDKHLIPQLDRITSETAGEDPIFTRIQEYEKSPSLNNLYNLIRLLEGDLICASVG